MIRAVPGESARRGALGPQRGEPRGLQAAPGTLCAAAGPAGSPRPRSLGLERPWLERAPPSPRGSGPWLPLARGTQKANKLWSGSCSSGWPHCWEQLQGNRGFSHALSWRLGPRGHRDQALPLAAARPESQGPSLHPSTVHHPPTQGGRPESRLRSQRRPAHADASKVVHSPLAAATESSLQNDRQGPPHPRRCRDATPQTPPRLQGGCGRALALSLLRASLPAQPAVLTPGNMS